jgi:hypothetical protein
MTMATEDIDNLRSDAKELAEDAQDTILNLIREQPVTSLVVTFLAGVVFGRLVL